jgi:hypothetical protein
MPIPSPRGRARDRLEHVGRERRPRRSGPARRLSRLGGNGPDRPGGLLRHPSGTTTGAPWRLKKRGMETFRRRVGAPVRRNFTMQRQAGAPSPLVPSRTLSGRADRASPSPLGAAPSSMRLQRPASTAARRARRGGRGGRTSLSSKLAERHGPRASAPAGAAGPMRSTTPTRTRRWSRRPAAGSKPPKTPRASGNWRTMRA